MWTRLKRTPFFLGIICGISCTNSFLVPGTNLQRAVYPSCPHLRQRHHCEAAFNMPRHAKKTKTKEASCSVVGPDYIQILKGSFQNKQVALVLCGESHEDAIDVTRRGGRFDPKEGWIEMERKDILSSPDGIMVKVLGTSRKSQAFLRSQEWATERVEDADVYGKIVLLWVEDEGGGGRKQKGKTFLLSIVVDEEDDDGSDSDSFDDDYYISPCSLDGERTLPSPVKEWILGEDQSTYKSCEWGDLDLQAFHLNERRLSDEEVEIKELDQIIQERKEKLREDDIWTWDDWFTDIRGHQYPDIDIQLILEASIPPWELSLYRPSVGDDIGMLPAADCIRSVGMDEEGDIEDYFDPSADGIGSYLDYIYRRFMEEQIRESDGQMTFSSWLHCVDMRDLGCQAACHSDSIEEMWKSLLSPEEANLLMTNGVNDKQHHKEFLDLEPDSAGEKIKFLPEIKMNPERQCLHSLRAEGKIKANDEVDTTDKNGEDGGEEFTYPSFEGFFGQNTDFLYYSKHVKLSYSPFLAKCVQSMENWKDFFTQLFLGGTIPQALSLLYLDSNKEYIYVRSPIHVNPESLEVQHRDDGEHHITYPFFPFLFHLTANGSSPPRTWSSNLFAKLLKGSGGDDFTNLAMAARDWTLEKIEFSSNDPKEADDPDCGGEWFEAYLYAVHRDIYNDIDTSDSTQLLKRKNVKSLTSNRKHNIGKIQIPSCQDGFVEISNCFQAASPVITPRAEVMAQILIDIWMSCLLDFSTILKIGDVVKKSENSKVVVVCYMGSAHTRAMAEFYVKRMGFKKKTFVGKLDYEENELRTIKLPKSLWNLNDLFGEKAA